MISTAIAWLGVAAGIWVANLALDDLRFKGGFGDYLITAAVFGALNFFLSWLFYAGLTIATLGLAIVFFFVTKVVVYAILLKVTAALSSRLEIKSFGTAIAAGFIISVCSSGADWLAERIG